MGAVIILVSNPTAEYGKETHSYYSFYSWECMENLLLRTSVQLHIHELIGVNAVCARKQWTHLGPILFVLCREIALFRRSFYYLKKKRRLSLLRGLSSFRVSFVRGSTNSGNISWVYTQKIREFIIMFSTAKTTKKITPRKFCALLYNSFTMSLPPDT